MCIERRVKRLVDLVKMPYFPHEDCKSIYLFIYLSIHLFIYLFVHLILVKHNVYRFILTFTTFEEVIQPLAVEMYMITCLLHAQHAFQPHN